ncbi:MAG: tyrosine-type recombinase/integrase [Sulfuricurvum sp.]|nr:tyrosine-type recombinase/integrase [Sulfuricurvum sp.]
MASCRTRRNKLYIDYVVDGERIRKSTGLDDTKQNRKLVNNTLIPKLLTIIVTGEIHKEKPKKFGKYFVLFLKRKNTNRSYDKKRHQWEILNQYFKDKDIDKITRLDVKTFVLDMPIQSSSKGVYKSALIEIFEMAIDEGVIKINPAINIKLPSDIKKEVDYFSKEEVNILLSHAHGIMRPYLLLALNTGMRPEEILGLQIGDISNERIDIKRVRTCGRIDHPKTRNSLRKIPCPDFVIREVLKIQSDHIFLFGNIDDVSKLHHEWWKLLKECGFEKRRLYSCRHTFATIMLQDGIVSINELAGLLGHSTPKVTLAHYASVIDAKTIDLGRNFDLFGTLKAHSKKEAF